MRNNKFEKYKKQLVEMKSTANHRMMREVEEHNEFIDYDERRMVNLSSNDYLGVGANRTLWNEFIKTNVLTAEGSFPASSCSSRLLTGNHSAFTTLENTLSSLYQSEAALIINSGYTVNLGVLPALTTANDLILADRLVHASMIDGIRLSAGKCIRFPHNDLEKLEQILEKERSNYDQVFIVSESIFSMDGDTCDLKKLVELKNKYNAILYIDEAHAIGVRGENGLGCAEEMGLLHEVDILVGTFGKSLASQGAFIICNQILKDYLVNTLRTLIFTTGLPPLTVKWCNYVMERLATLKAERAHLKRISDLLRTHLHELGFETAGSSHIVPIIVRDLQKTVELSEYICQQGFFVLPIRHPTVPRGTERIRISLTAAIKEQQILDLITLCKHIGN